MSMDFDEDVFKEVDWNTHFRYAAASLFDRALPMSRENTYVNAESVSGTIIFYPVFSKELMVQEKIQRDLQEYLDSQLAEYLEASGLVPLGAEYPFTPQYYEEPKDDT